VGREKINLDLEISIFRGKLLQLASVDTQETFDEGLIVLVNGAAVDNTDAEKSRSFVQTFFLGKDPEEGGFFIRNTVIRFLAKKDAPVNSQKTAEAPKSPVKVVVKEEAVDKRVAPVPAPKAVEVSTPTAESAPAKGKKKSSNNLKKEEKKEEKKEVEKKVEEKKVEEKKAPASFLDAARRNAAKGMAAGPPKGKEGKKSAGKEKEGGAKNGNGNANNNKGGPVKGASGNNKNGGDSKNKNNNAANNSNNNNNTNNTNNNNNNKNEKKGKKEKESKEDKGNHINTNAQCYVSNIAFSTANEDLTKLLSQFGKVKSVTRPPTKGYGFVEFFEDKDSKKAIVNAKNISLVLDGRELKIEERTGQSSSSSAGPTKEGAKKKKEGGNREKKKN
jgi:hypothetical protein